MDVVGVVLRIVVLNQERRGLNPVIMRAATLFDACPGKEHVRAGLFHLLHARLRELFGHIARIAREQRQQQVELLLGHLRG